MTDGLGGFTRFARHHMPNMGRVGRCSSSQCWRAVFAVCAGCGSPICRTCAGRLDGDPLKVVYCLTCFCPRWDAARFGDRREGDA